MAIFLFSQILKFTYYSIKLIEKLSRRHLINSSDVFVIKGFTVFYFLNKTTTYLEDFGDLLREYNRLVLGASPASFNLE